MDIEEFIEEFIRDEQLKKVEYDDVVLGKGTLFRLLKKYDKEKYESSLMRHILTDLISKNIVFNEAVSFAECNSSRDFEETKATFIGGVHWLKAYIEENLEPN